jgi:two-component system sensor histidine kinase HydH
VEIESDDLVERRMTVSRRKLAVILVALVVVAIFLALWTTWEAGTQLTSLVVVLVTLATLALILLIRAGSAKRLERARSQNTESEKRHHSERLAAAGALSAGVAHEIRNPLNAISIAAQRILRRKEADEHYHRFAETILSEVGHMEEILRGFLDLARPSRGPYENVELVSLTAGVVELLEGEATEKGVALNMTSDRSTMSTHGDPACLRRSLVNLILNAIEVSPDSAEVAVRLEKREESIRITVSDQGEGMLPEVRRHAFDPFFTTRAEGSGLGLPLVRRVAEEHGGWAQLLDRKGGGVDAIMEIAWPGSLPPAGRGRS